MNEPTGEETIFAEALRLPAEERAAYLAQATHGDAELRRRVEALLGSYPTGEFLEQAAAPQLRQTVSVPLTEKPGDRIGRYKLLEQIGEGGCGVVYVAEQTEPVRRRVALKIVKLGMDTKSVIARFEAERQALALMDHPNIARVFDAGATETGRPYFVMELVRGVKITEYCDEKKLSPNERLDLFIQVCQAIQHAHQKGIIHRDIKPSNILVTVNDPDKIGMPKVIDFGVAKATGGQVLTDKTVYTAFEQFIGTPAYMSPEQAVLTSLDIDTRSDIYALGVLLYEMLTGRTPFDTKELLAVGLDEMRRTIREKEPERPSTRLSTLSGQELSTTAQRRGLEAPKLVSELRGDLDWIVMKALEKDRARRYETANGLAADIQRHLNCEPVVACPPSKFYELQKTVRRHKVGFAATAVIIITLFAGVLVSTWQAVRATRAKRAALAAQATEQFQRQKADALAAENETNYQTARLNLYAADMAAAEQALSLHNFARARQLLDAYRPKPGQKDLRGVEWRYLWAASAGDQIATLNVGTPVNAVAVSPDGKLIAVAGVSGPIQLWDVAALRRVGSFGDQTNVWRDVAFAPGGQTLAACGRRGHLELWNITSHQLVMSVRLHAQLCLAFSPDGNLLAVAAGDGSIYTAQGSITLYDVPTGKELATLPESGGRDVAFSRDGKLLATGPLDWKVKIWDVTSRRLLQSIPTDNMYSLCFSADGRSLFTAGPSGVRQLNRTNGAVEQIFSSRHDFFNCPSLSPDGRWLACGGGDGRVEIWNVADGNSAVILRGHQGGVNRNSLAFTRDGTMLLSGSADQTVRLWRTAFTPAASGNSIAEVQVPYFRRQRHRPYSSNGKWLAARFGQGIQIVDIKHCRVRSFLPTQAFPVGFLPGDKVLLALDVPFWLGRPSAQRIELWDFEHHTNQLIPLRNLPTEAVMAYAMSPDGTQLVMALVSSPVRTRTLYSVDVRAGDCVPLNLKLRGNLFGGLAFSPDGHYLAVGNGGETLLCHWPQVGDFVELSGHHNNVLTPVFSPDGTRVATGDEGGEVRVWEMPSGKLLFVLAGEEQSGFDASFSPDGQTLATSGEDTVRLWQLSTGRKLMSFDNTLSVEFSPDGRSMARVTTDQMLYLAHLPTLHEIDNPQPQTLAEARQSRPEGFEPVIGLFDALAPAEQEAFYREKLALLRETLGDDDPNEADTLVGFAQVLEQEGKSAKAAALIRDFPKAADGGSQNDAAWMLATSPYPELRDGSNAVVLAEKAVTGSGRRDANNLNTLAAAYAEAGQFGKAVATEKEAIALLPKGNTDERYANCLSLYESSNPYRDPGVLAVNVYALLLAGKFAEAEPLARECLRLREKIIPNGWLTFNAQSMLGCSLLGQKKYVEAEPLLLSAYQGLKQREDQILANVRQLRLKEAIERLVQLYQATGQTEKAAEWKQKLAELKPAEK